MGRNLYVLLIALYIGISEYLAPVAAEWPDIAGFGAFPLDYRFVLYVTGCMCWMA